MSLAGISAGEKVLDLAPRCPRVDWLLALATALAWCAAAAAAHAHAGRRLHPPPPRGIPRGGHVAGPRVSVIVPARNEERNLGRCLASLARLEHAELEIVVVAGGEDRTLAIAQEFAARDARFRVLAEPPLPTGWVGKPWACHVGRAAATGEVLLFTDADTEHAPGSLARALAELGDADFLTGLTGQVFSSVAERVAMPATFMLIRGATGGEMMVEDPRHAIANGQYMMFRAASYDALGGHEAVRASVVEDLALARLVAGSRMKARFVSLVGLVTVRMYAGAREMFDGWRKNLAAGAAATPPLSTLATAAAVLAALSSAPVAAWALLAGAWGAAALALAAFAVTTWRVAVELAMAPRESRAWALLHPLGVAFFCAAFAASVADRWRGRGVEWKGRRYFQSKGESR